MQAIDDFAAAVQANFDKLSGDLDTITTGIAALDKMIQDLQNGPGTLGPADQATLDKIAAASAALAAKADAVNVNPPTPPAK